MTKEQMTKKVQYTYDNNKTDQWRNNLSKLTTFNFCIVHCYRWTTASYQMKNAKQK